MVESKGEQGLTFDDLLNEKNVSFKINRWASVWQEAEDNIDQIRAKQQSCMVKDLKEKYRPDQVEGYVAPQVSLS